MTGKRVRQIALAAVLLVGVNFEDVARAGVAGIPHCTPPAVVDTTGWRRHVVAEGISIALPPDFEEFKLPSVEWQRIWRANGVRVWANGGIYSTDAAPSPEYAHCRMKLDGLSVDVTTHSNGPAWLHAVWLSQPPGPGSIGGDTPNPKDLPLIWTAVSSVRVRMGFWRRIFAHIL